jgi:hypothetical protein
MWKQPNRRIQVRVEERLIPQIVHRKDIPNTVITHNKFIDPIIIIN